MKSGRPSETLWSRLLGWFWPQAKEIDQDMKYLIIGLGNIGSEYEETRHNIGFKVVEHLADNKDAHFKEVKYGSQCMVKHRGRQLILHKPNTFMNLSGKAVKYWMDKEKIKLSNVLIVLDDLNLSFGEVRLRDKGSDGGHNGLKDIQQTLGHNKYPRLRVGIGDDFKRGQQVDFVLGKWDADEKSSLPKIIEHCGAAAEAFSFRGLKEAMNQFNGKVK